MNSLNDDKRKLKSYNVFQIEVKKKEKKKRKENMLKRTIAIKLPVIVECTLYVIANMLKHI